MQSAPHLFENHLKFLATHRGRVTHLNGSYAVESDRPEFTYGVLGQGSDPGLLNRFATVQALPWGDCLDPSLVDERFQKKASLSYMAFEGGTGAWPINSRIQVKRVNDTADMDVFSHVQAAGFAQKPEDYEQWHPWLRAANHRNLNRDDQAFYIGYMNDNPVGTALIVRTGNLAGIYAVATIPNFRKQGVGSSVMSRAISDARSMDSEAITLQVVEGSYAESLYKKLGFKTAFNTSIFSR